MRLLLALAVLGCNDVRLRTDDGEPVPIDPPVPPPVAITAAPAFDPLFGPLVVEVSAPPDAALALEIHGDDGTVAERTGTADADGRWTTRWDARTGARWQAAGTYTLVVTSGEQHDEAEVGVVRAGFVTARLEGDREPLYFPLDRELQDPGAPVAALPAIDDGELPLDFVAVVDGPMARRPDGNEPVAFRFDARPTLVLEPAATSALGETGLARIDVAVSADGWTVVSGVPLRPGVPVVLAHDAPLGDTVGVSELDVALTFAVDDVPIGTQRLPLRLYRVLDRSQYPSPADKYRPWAPVLAQALPAVEGTPAEPWAVLDALVGFVYADLGLVYDTQSGAAVYSTYAGFGFSEPHFFLSDFLARRNGNVINCSDAGNILGAYANMIGAPLDHVIIDPSFGLNFIRAIGATSYTRCPFGAGGCSFSYHAVTSAPDSERIWDATLALDGDADPRTTPNTELLVQQIPAEEYLERLVRSGTPHYRSPSRGTLE